MEYTNKSEMHQFDSSAADLSKIDLINHLRHLSKSDIAEVQPEITKPKSDLAKQMEGLSFEEQKEMLNKMSASRSTTRINEYVGKRYSLEQIKALDVSVNESIKLLINEAAVAPRMDMKSVTLMVDDFHRSRKDESSNDQVVIDKPTHRKVAKV